jgi:hypothetical protein
MSRVAVRSRFVLFAAMFMNTDPLPVPLAPDVIVIHEAVLVAVHEQVLAAVTVIPRNAMPGVRAMVVGDNATEHEAAACVTENGRPPIVSDPVRAAPVALAVIA